MVSIPASVLVDVNPGVIDVGGSGLDLTALILTASTRVPIGVPVRFLSTTAVAAYFGALSTEATLAQIYFDGFDGSSAKPVGVTFYQYATSAVAAYVRGGTPLTLPQLQAMTGTLTLTVDGRSVTSSSISLGSSTSLSNAATLIQAGLNDADAVTNGSISGPTLTVTSGAGIAVGQTITGIGVAAGTKVVSGAGTTWTVSAPQTVTTTALTFGQTTVAYDSQSGAFVVTAGTPGATGTISFVGGTLATALALTQATGAVISQGAGASVPATAMNAALAQTQNFATFLTTFKPSAADMLAFSAWNNAQDSGYLYLAWDNDTVPTTATDTSSVGYQVRQAGYGGTAMLYDPSNGAQLAAFVAGAVASLNFAQTNGRRALAYLSSADIAAGVSDATAAANLTTNGYSFYGAYGSRANNFVMLQNGQVSGKFAWIDTYVNQIKLNDAMQVALITLLQNQRVPYTPTGYALIETAMAGPVQDALNYGSIVPGVVLSQAQVAAVNAIAGGRNVADTIRERGWYILVSDPGPTVRGQRKSPIVYLFYSDGQVVQQIVVTSDALK